MARFNAPPPIFFTSKLLNRVSILRLFSYHLSYVKPSNSSEAQLHKWSKPETDAMFGVLILFLIYFSDSISTLRREICNFAPVLLVPATRNKFVFSHWKMQMAFVTNNDNVFRIFDAKRVLFAVPVHFLLHSRSLSTILISVVCMCPHLNNQKLPLHDFFLNGSG